MIDFFIVFLYLWIFEVVAPEEISIITIMPRQNNSTKLCKTVYKHCHSTKFPEYKVTCLKCTKIGFKYFC